MTGALSATSSETSGSANRAGSPLTMPFSSKNSVCRPTSFVSPLCWMPNRISLCMLEPIVQFVPVDHTHQPESNVSLLIGKPGIGHTRRPCCVLVVAVVAAS